MARGTLVQSMHHNISMPLRMGCHLVGRASRAKQWAAGRVQLQRLLCAMSGWNVCVVRRLQQDLQQAHWHEVPPCDPRSRLQQQIPLLRVLYLTDAIHPQAL
jgi:hypothetical protein